MIRRPPRSTHCISSAASDVYKRQSLTLCLEAAIDRNEPWGVWGGQLFRKGKILANKRGRGRPRKISRPEDELPVIPIPVHLQSTLRSA